MKRLLLVMLLPNMAFASSLFEINAGPSISITPYLRIDAEEAPKPYQFPEGGVHPAFPIKSSIKAGRFQSYKKDNCAMSQSFFIIGDDALSQSWLEQHKSKLLKENAIGYATNIKSFDDFKSLSELYPKPLLPINVDAIAASIEAPFYPLFHTHCEVYQ